MFCSYLKIKRLQTELKATQNDNMHLSDVIKAQETKEIRGKYPLLETLQHAEERVKKQIQKIQDLQTKIGLENSIPASIPSPPTIDDLFLAATNGHEEVVRLLLCRNDVNPDSKDDRGRTPLWRASQNGHINVVRPLLERNDV